MSKSLSGKNIDFLFESSPPITTLQITSGFCTFTTSNIIRPLFKRILSPGFIWSQIPLNETLTLFWSPSMSSVVNANSSPSCSIILPSLNVPILNSGPFVSSMMGRGTFILSRTLFIVFIFLRCSSCVP